MNKPVASTPNAHRGRRQIDGPLPTGLGAAYDDRTAWLMACLSQLAYEPYDQQDHLNQAWALLLDDNVPELKDKPAPSSIKIIQSYDVDDTQALLLSSDAYLVLAFRGTEANSLTDIKTGANAVLAACSSGGRVHSGYNDAFNLIEAQIESDLASPQNRDRPLIITGHSLGGALAAIAAKRLHHTGEILACYSFGSPRIGNAQWSHNINVPIYRIVNALDYFTRLPPGGDTIGSLKFVVGRLPVIGTRLRDNLTKFQGYTHGGHLRHLTDCKPDQYEHVQLVLKIPLWERSRIWLRSMTLRKSVRDHSISIYRKKLAVIAARHLADGSRNPRNAGANNTSAG